MVPGADLALFRSQHVKCPLRERALMHISLALRPESKEGRQSVDAMGSERDTTDTSLSTEDGGYACITGPQNPDVEHAIRQVHDEPDHLGESIAKAYYCCYSSNPMYSTMQGTLIIHQSRQARAEQVLARKPGNMVSFTFTFTW